MKKCYIAKDIITQSYIIKCNANSHAELTIFKQYASVFTSKAEAYKYAWRIFKIHKYDLDLEQLENA